jgi:hypothetical protein
MIDLINVYKKSRSFIRLLKKLRNKYPGKPLNEALLLYFKGVEELRLSIVMKGEPSPSILYMMESYLLQNGFDYVQEVDENKTVIAIITFSSEEDKKKILDYYCKIIYDQFIDPKKNSE